MWVERKGGLNGRGSLGILMGVESKIVKIQVLYIGVERNSVGREIFCGANRTTLSLFFFFFFLSENNASVTVVLGMENFGPTYIRSA